MGIVSEVASEHGQKDMRGRALRAVTEAFATYPLNNDLYARVIEAIESLDTDPL